MTTHRDRVHMSPEHIRIAELAKEDRERKFTSIAHLMTVDALQEAFESLRKDASAGVDGVTYTEYAAAVRENLEQLHDRLKQGQYRAQPLRRIYIPKEDGRQRPISIPSLEDKIVQKAAGGLLQAIYEQDFLNCSYGFRPGRGPQDAVDERSECKPDRAQPSDRRGGAGDLSPSDLDDIGSGHFRILRRDREESAHRDDRKKGP
jgi:RNA-directed DNA polymerase